MERSLNNPAMEGCEQTGTRRVAAISFLDVGLSQESNDSSHEVMDGTGLWWSAALPSFMAIDWMSQ